MRTLGAFSQLKSLLRQNTLKLRVEHENLETVYLEPTSDGRILVHDRAHAHTYLSTKQDKTFLDWSDLGIEHIRMQCDLLGLSLENLLGDDNDPGYCICGRASTDLEVAELVNRIAECQDKIFESAYRNPT